jgi:hypothetical protein
MTQIEKREYPRYLCSLKGSFTFMDQTWDMLTLDVSIQGIRFQTLLPIPTLSEDSEFLILSFELSILPQLKFQGKIANILIYPEQTIECGLDIFHLTEETKSRWNLFVETISQRQRS